MAGHRARGELGGPPGRPACGSPAQDQREGGGRFSVGGVMDRNLLLQSPLDAEEAGQERRRGKVHGGHPVSRGVTAMGDSWGAGEKPMDLRSILVPGCLKGCTERRITFLSRPHDSGFKTVTDFPSRLDFLTK